jgi:hypothetical protein
MMTARFGRSSARDAASRLRDECPDLDLRPSWRLFASLADWGMRWPAERYTFAAGLILSAANNPVVERAVGRCLADLTKLGLPLLWGAVSQRVRWQSRFRLAANGWSPEQILPYPPEYARLGVANDTPEFCPWFDPILFSAEQDFFILNSRLRWREARHSLRVTRHG